MNKNHIKNIGILAIINSNLADGLLVGLVPLLAYEISNNVFYISLMSLIRPISLLCCGIIISSMLNKYSNKFLLRSSFIFRIITITVFIIISLKQFSLISLTLFAFFFYFSELIIDSITSTLPRKLFSLNEKNELEKTNADIQLSNSISNDLIGPTLAGLLISLHIFANFYIMIMLLIISLYLITKIDIIFIDNKSSTTDKKTTPRIKFNSKLKQLFKLSTMLSFYFGMYGAIFIIHARSEVNASPFEFGILLALFSVGCIVHRIFPNIIKTPSQYQIVQALILIMISTLISINAHHIITLCFSQLIAGYGFMKWLIEESNFKLLHSNIDILEYLNAKFRMWESILFSLGAITSGLLLSYYPNMTTRNIYIIIFLLELLILSPLTIIFAKNSINGLKDKNNAE